MVNEHELAYQIVYNAVESIVSINHSGVILGFNPAATKLFGFECNEVIGKNVHILIPPEHASHHNEYICRYMTTKIRRMEWLHSEISIQLKNKSVVSVIMTLSEALINNEKIFTCTMRLKYSIVCIKDVAAHALIENTFDAIVTINAKCIIKYFNTAAEKLFGYISSEVIGRNVKILMTSPHTENHDGYMCTYLRTNIKKVIGYTHEFTAVRKDTSRFPLRIMVTEVDVNGVRLFTGTMHDISKYHIEQEIIYEATRVKKDFLARMTHELRTPLNGIIGMSNILDNTSLTPEQKHIVQTIVSSGEGLLQTVNNVLDFSKVDVHKLILLHVPIDLHKIVDQVAKMLVPSARIKNLHLYISIDETVCTEVFGDTNVIKQVYVNIVGNAIKFTEHGTVQVIVVCTHLDDTTVMIQTEVRDTGIGISDPDILFKPFVQADMSTTRKFDGTGLGLTISKSMLQLMHGDIGISPGVENGSRVWFTMKLDKQVKSTKKTEKTQHKAVVVLTNDIFLYETISMYLVAWKYPHIMEDASRLTLATTTTRFFTSDLDIVFLCDIIHIRNTKTCNSTILAMFPNATLIDIKYLCDSDNLPDSTLEHWISRPVNRDDLYKALRCEKFINKPKTPQMIKLLTGLVLIAEDNLINQKVMQMYIKRLGFITDIANNGIEVLQKLQECKTYRLILMDCHMPQMDGFTCTRVIRANETENKSPRILIAACTGGVFDDDKHHCIESGMDIFIAKPVRVNELTSVLRRAGL